MIDDSSDEDQALERRMRAKLGVREPEPPRPPQIVEPLPARVLVRKERVWGMSELHYRWFFIPVDVGGQRGRASSTTNENFAKKEVARFEKLGIPMEVLKEVEFE